MNEKEKMLTIIFSKDEHKKIKQFCLDQDCFISDLIRKLIREHMQLSSERQIRR